MEQTAGIKNFLPKNRSEWLVYLFCTMVFVGFSCSRLLISLGVIGLCVWGVYLQGFKAVWNTYKASPTYWVSALFFIVIVLSGFNSTDHSSWLNFVRIKLPFLFLPLGFCGYRFIDRPLFNKILLCFSVCMLLSAVGVMGNYLLHFATINESIRSGQTIPVPFSHIRYTLLLVFTFFCLLWLWEQRSEVYGHWLLLPALCVFILIHILSSRSGWVALYVGLVFYLLQFMYYHRRYAVGLLLLVLVALAPYYLYRVIPSFQNKVDYMHYSFGESEKGHIDDNSDGMRIASWQVGIEIIERHPVFGTGVGDLQAVSKEVSKELFPNIKNDDDRKMPHNEWLWIWAATGIFGLIGYCIAFFYPFVSNLKQRNWLFVILHLIFITSFVSEYSLEEQIGSTFYLLFLLLFLSHFSTQQVSHD